MRGQTRAWRTWAVVMMAGTLASEETWAAESPRRPAESAVGTPARRIIVSLPERKLAVVEGNTVLRLFPIAVGRPDTPSPVGTFTITDRIPNPTYYTTGKVIPPGAANPLGTRWLGLSLKGYGIHGTDNPRSIGYARSHGCVRLRNRDVEDLFELVRSGDRVELLAETTTETTWIFADHLPSRMITAALPAPSF